MLRRVSGGAASSAAFFSDHAATSPRRVSAGLSFLEHIAPSGVPGWVCGVLGQGGAQHLIRCPSRWRDIDHCIGGWARFWRGRFGCAASVRKSSVARIRSRTDRYAFPGLLRALGCTIGVRLLPSARGWMIGSWGRRPNVGNRPRFRSSRKCMRRWLGLGRHLFLPETGLVPPPSSPPSTVERPKGMWRSPQSSVPLPCSFARKALPPGGVIHAFRPGPVSSRPL